MKQKKSILHPLRQSRIVELPLSDAIFMDNWLYVSGQASVDLFAGTFILADIREETKRTLDNIQAILGQVGMTLEDVVKCTVHLSDIDDFECSNEVYSKYFQGIKPARTTVQSVLMKGLKVEVDCVARKGSSS